MIGLTRIMLVLALAGNSLSSDVLASGKSFFKREADVFISRVRRGFAAEDANALARSLWAFTNFVNEVIRWSDPESGFRIYALAHAIREVPEVSNMDEFFARFAYGIFAQVDVNLMSQEGIIREDRRVDVVNLFGQASKFGLDLSDVVTLLQLPETQLKDGLTVLSGADDIEANGRKVLVSWHLRQSHRISQQNPSAGRLFELLRRNLAVPDNIRMEIFFDRDLGEQITLFLSLEPVSSGLWMDARVTRMMNLLGELFELLPYIRAREHTVLLFNAFQTLLSALASNIMVPWFDEILLQLETLVREMNVSLKIFPEIAPGNGLWNFEINFKKLFQLRDRVENTGEKNYSFESRISIIPKLALYIDRASMLLKRKYPYLPDERDLVALVTAFVDTSLSVLADSTSNNRNLLVGLAEVIRAGTVFIDSHRSDCYSYAIFSSYAMALQITFELYHRFGVFNPVFLNGLTTGRLERFWWPTQRINSIRIIMKSFLIFGKAEWNKLLVRSQGEKQHFAELFAQVSLAHVDKAAKFLARQALWRMKMYRENEEPQHEDDAPLFSPAEWLKLYIGGRSRYALWELNFSRSMSARDPVAVFGEGAVLPELRRRISSYLPFDRNTPTELSALAQDISALNDEIRYSPRISLLRSISNSLLRLPRLILQAEAELNILRGDKYIRWREILIKSARSLTATLREAATSDEGNPHIIANINHIDEFTEQVVLILEDLASPWSMIKYLFLKYKFDQLERLTHRIDRLQTDILNGLHTEGF